MKMEGFNLTINVNINLSDDVKSFLSTLFSQATTCTCSTCGPYNDDFKPAIPLAEVPVKETASKPQNTVASAVNEEPANKQNTATKPAVVTTSAHTLADLRQLLAEKVNDHRDAIKKQLAAFDAPSLTKLDQSKYDEMYNFLKNLA